MKNMMVTNIVDIHGNTFFWDEKGDWLSIINNHIILRYTHIEEKQYWNNMYGYLYNYLLYNSRKFN